MEVLILALFAMLSHLYLRCVVNIVEQDMDCKSWVGPDDTGCYRELFLSPEAEWWQVGMISAARGLGYSFTGHCSYKQTSDMTT